MICPKCHAENAEDAKFCTNCGAELHPQIQSEKSNSDVLLVVMLGLMVVFNIFYFAFSKLVPNWWESKTAIITYFCVNVLSNLTWVCIPLSIRQKKMKIVGFVIYGILLIYWLISNILSMSDQLSSLASYAN